MFALIVLGNTNVFASDFSIDDFMATVKVFNSGSDNFWIARDVKTGDLYFPGMSRGDVGNYYRYQWSYISAKGNLGLLLEGVDTWVLNKYDFKTGQISTVSLSDIGRVDFFQLKTSERDLKIIYSYDDIIYRKFYFSDDIVGMNVGDVYFKKTSELVIPQDYITDVSELPNIVNNIITYILPFCLVFFGIILLIILIKRVFNKFM